MDTKLTEGRSIKRVRIELGRKGQLQSLCDSDWARTGVLSGISNDTWFCLKSDGSWGKGGGWGHLMLRAGMLIDRPYFLE